jgi:hypothetical protein
MAGTAVWVFLACTAVVAPFARGGVWVVAGFFGLATVMNAITPSKIERVWAPVVLTPCITCLIVATG